jgi:hypothetical protein
VQGAGIGTAIMERVQKSSSSSGSIVEIAASHKSAPFFARFGARETARIEHGWAPGMHRVDMLQQPQQQQQRRPHPPRASPTASVEMLHGIVPDFDQVTRVSRALNVVGYHLFVLLPGTRASTAHCRNLAPLYDIPEESATGTANAALACYLYVHGVLQAEPNDDQQQQQQQVTAVMEQGHSMGLPSQIRVVLDLKGANTCEAAGAGTQQPQQRAGHIARVRVGGLAQEDDAGTRQIEVD